MENLEALAFIIGVINGIRLLEINKKGFFYFLGAVAVGAVAGSLGWFGLDLLTGIIAGLASSGLYRVSEKLGGQ